ncbi:MAG: TIGR02301 family protein [Hyphomonadaceae bacterium]
MRHALLFLAFLGCGLVPVAAAPAAHAQESAGPDGPSLALLEDLASMLGQAHAIRSVCNGDSDQTWRNYMFELLNLEGPRGPRRSALTSAFNRGYRIQSRSNGRCTADLVSVEAAIAARGRQLADEAAAAYLQ